jgi:phage gpG-like protein
VKVYQTKRVKSLIEALQMDTAMADRCAKAADISFRKIETNQFSSEGRMGRTGQWAPLSPDYAARKYAAVGRRKILVWSGKMRDSFTKLTDEHIAEAVRVGANWHLRFGSKNRIAPYHQQEESGGSFHAIRKAARFTKLAAGLGGGLPRRPPIDLSDNQVAQMKGAIRHVFDQQWERVQRAGYALEQR